MSVLLIGASGELGEAVITRLARAGDQVEVIEPSAADAAIWRAKGARVAVAETIDTDLVERAGQQARTIVVFGDDSDRTIRSVKTVLAAATALKESPRIVVCTTATADGVLDILEASALDYVVLRTSKKARRLLAKGKPHAPEDVAEAIDAADDLGGNPRLEIDLAAAEGWSKLKLEAR